LGLISSVNNRPHPGGKVSEQTMRGMRLGSQSLENEANVNLAARSRHTFICGDGHVTEIVFAAEAELPETWQCRQCSHLAALVTDGKHVELEISSTRPGRSHYEMLLERRSTEELEEILKERIAYIKARRALGKVEL
jgi:hypothetical protein